MGPKLGPCCPLVCYKTPSRPSFGRAGCHAGREEHCNALLSLQVAVACVCESVSERVNHLHMHRTRTLDYVRRIVMEVLIPGEGERLPKNMIRNASKSGASICVYPTTVASCPFYRSTRYDDTMLLWLTRFCPSSTRKLSRSPRNRI